MRFVLYRILGNDLPPRHSPTQTEDNLRFILAHEGALPDCEKRFYLNRIVDSEKESRLREMLDAHGCTYVTDPFVLQDFRKCIGRQARVRYLTNVNSARNACVRLGLADGEVALPCDGGSFFRPDGWRLFANTAQDCPADGFFGVPTWRLENYGQALGEEAPALREEYHFSDVERVIGLRECTLAFTKHQDALFDESLVYGNVDKAELMWRLGIPGAWDRWSTDVRRQSMQRASKFAGRVRVAGFVCRLPSGDAVGDGHNLRRGAHRAEGVQRLVETTVGVV